MSMIYLRCASVTVFIGDGLNATAPGHSDVTILETHVNSYHGHNERYLIPLRYIP